MTVPLIKPIRKKVEINSVNTKNLLSRFEPRTYKYADTLKPINNDFPEFNKKLNLHNKYIIIGMFVNDRKLICKGSCSWTVPFCKWFTKQSN